MTRIQLLVPTISRTHACPSTTRSDEPQLLVLSIHRCILILPLSQPNLLSALRPLRPFGIANLMTTLPPNSHHSPGPHPFSFPTTAGTCEGTVTVERGVVVLTVHVFGHGTLGRIRHQERISPILVVFHPRLRTDARLRVRIQHAIRCDFGKSNRSSSACGRTRGTPPQIPPLTIAGCLNPPSSAVLIYPLNSMDSHYNYASSSTYSPPRLHYGISPRPVYAIHSGTDSNAASTDYRSYRAHDYTLCDPSNHSPRPSTGSAGPVDSNVQVRSISPCSLVSPDI